MFFLGCDFSILAGQDLNHLINFFMLNTSLLSTSDMLNRNPTRPYCALRFADLDPAYEPNGSSVGFGWLVLVEVDAPIKIILIES